MEAEKIYRQYQRGKNYLQKYGYYDRAEQCYKYYNGDQWNGLKVAGEKQPAFNILAPIVDYKVATVAQNGMTINYNTANYGEMYEECMEICETLNAYALKNWERLKLDSLCWKYIEEAAVVGDAFIYFYEKNGLIEVQSVDATNVHLADEQESSIQEQKYIIISQRLFVSDVRRQAKQNGIEDVEIELIQPDDDTQLQIGDKAKDEIEHDDEDGKCLCLLKMWKENGEVHFLRSTKNVIYEKDTTIKGLKLYPVVHMRWDREKGSARGIGEVYHRIPNQIHINKTLARNLASIKQTAYPHLVYSKDQLTPDQIKRLSTVGATIGVGNNRPVEDIKKSVMYLYPAHINQAAVNIVDDMMETTRGLAGAGEAVTGNINPEQASGAAIIAVRDASALPLNNQIAAFRQFVEDIALIWFDMWCAYNPNGLEVVTEIKDEATGKTQPQAQIIPAEMLQGLKIEVRIDVSPSNPFSKYAQEQALERLLEKQLISFEDYVEALDDDAAAPKAKLKEILEKQKLRAQQQLAAQQEQMMQQDALAKANATIEQLLRERALYMAENKIDEREEQNGYTGLLENGAYSAGESY